MHEGFAGGAFIDTSGKVIGIATAAAIRGLGVIIPAPIAWKTAAALLEHGRMRRGYIGIAAQPARLGDRALLVVDVRAGSPAEKGGLLAGDLLLTFDGQPVEGPEGLLELLAEDRVGKEVGVRLLRGDNVTDVRVTVADRPDRQ
jgi:S1-C subfamily serine protease